MRSEVLDYLDKIDKLDQYSYSYLINTYGEILVKNVLDEISDSDLFKYEYYVNTICYYDSCVVSKGYNAYLKDISGYSVNSNDDNMRLLKELCIIKEKIDLIIGDDICGSLLADKVKIYLENNRDKKLENLYLEFCNKRNEIVMGNLLFVIYVSKKYLCLYNDLSVLVQYGNIGLMEAIEKYDFKYGSSFITYAYYRIKKSILNNVTLDKTNFKISYDIARLNIKISKVVKELSVKLNRYPTIDEVASYLDINVDKVNRVNNIFGNMISFSDYVSKDELNGLTYGDCIEDENNLEDDVINRQFVLEFREFLRKVLSRNEYMVICHRYEIDNYPYLVLEQLAKKMGYCTEGVRKIEKRALKKIRENGRELCEY